MAKPKMTGSATLHHRMVAFSGMFGVYALSFPPLIAVLLTLVSAAYLAKL